MNVHRNSYSSLFNLIEILLHLHYLSGDPFSRGNSSALFLISEPSLTLNFFKSFPEIFHSYELLKFPMMHTRLVVKVILADALSESLGVELPEFFLENIKIESLLLL